jgi:hypothetical protein
MMREGDGEKLESIAESESLPAPRVRKRVSRLRKHLRDQWKKEVALLAALGLVAVLVVLALRARRPERVPIARDPSPPVPSHVVPRDERSLPAIDPRTAPSSTLPPSPTPSASPSPSSRAVPTAPTSAPRARSTPAPSSTSPLSSSLSDVQAPSPISSASPRPSTKAHRGK